MPTTTETRTGERRPGSLAATVALLGAMLLVGGCDGGIFGTGDGGPAPPVDAGAPSLAAPQESGGNAETGDAEVPEPSVESDTPATSDAGDAPEPLPDIERRLTGRTWTLVSFERDDGSTVPVGIDGAASYTLAFRAGTSAAGELSRTFGGVHVCNDIAGTYTLEGSVLALDVDAATELDCAAAGTEAATVVTRVLLTGAPAMITFEGDRLVLRSATNEALRYDVDVGEEGASDPD